MGWFILKIVALIAVASLLFLGCGSDYDDGTAGGGASITEEEVDDMIGSYSHARDDDICDEYACVSTFEEGDGYIAVCDDGYLTHSGGVQGACSHHGGLE